MNGLAPANVVPPATPLNLVRSAGTAARSATRRALMNDRVALLVIHGMGSQKPYETLDQFARGIESSLSSATEGRYHHELRFRQHEEDPAHQQKAWTQVYARLTPADPTAAAAASRP